MSANCLEILLLDNGVCHVTMTLQSTPGCGYERKENGIEQNGGEIERKEENGNYLACCT